MGVSRALQGKVHLRSMETSNCIRYFTVFPYKAPWAEQADKIAKGEEKLPSFISTFFGAGRSKTAARSDPHYLLKLEKFAQLNK